MWSEEQPITCIYCKQVRPPSREHVLARSLGGAATSPITCKPCNNTSLSRLDRAIAERSMIALSRVGETPAEAFDVRLGGEHFHRDIARDLHTEINMVNGLRPVPFPQIHFRLGTGEVMVIASDQDEVKALVVFIDYHIANGTLRSMHVKQGPIDRCTTARIVMHRSRDGFVRVRDAGDEQRVYSSMEGCWPTLRVQVTGGQFVAESEAKPTFSTVRHGNTALDVEAIYERLVRRGQKG